MRTFNVAAVEKEVRLLPAHNGGKLRESAHAVARQHLLRVAQEQLQQSLLGAGEVERPDPGERVDARRGRKP